MHAEPVFCKHRQHYKVESQESAASYHIMYSICYCLLQYGPCSHHIDSSITLEQ